MAYNFSAIDNSSTLVEWFTGLNALTGQLFFSIMLFFVFIALVYALSRYDIKVGLLAGSFITSVVAVLMALAGDLIPYAVMVMPIAALFFATVWYIIDNRR